MKRLTLRLTINAGCQPRPCLSTRPTIPPNALRDENGVPIKDENGNFILLDLP